MESSGNIGETLLMLAESVCKRKTTPSALILLFAIRIANHYHYDLFSVRFDIGPVCKMIQSNRFHFGTFNLVARIAAALLGGYAFTWGFVSVGVAGLTGLGVDFHEAETAMLMLAFLLFLGLFLWTFACHSIVRVWTVLAGGGAVMTLTAWAIQQAMLS